ncbi:MAG: hypothetical protein HFJ09_01755 [Lachnospiraceae bacterium]|nr:hypothetical protein [Lachnospiraceae bacterium]
MTIFLLLAGGMLFLVLTGIIIAIDNHKRKYKKKILAFHWRIIGIVTTVLAFVCLTQFTGKILNFEGTECGDRKILLRTTTRLADVKIPSKNATLDTTLEEGYEQILEGIEKGSREIKLEYVDALLNKKHLVLEEIREVKYSKDLTAKQVQFVEYLVIEKDGHFTKPGIHYYIIFGQDLLEEKEKEKEESKKKTDNKKSSGKKK